MPNKAGQECLTSWNMALCSFPVTGGQRFLANSLFPVPPLAELDLPSSRKTEGIANIRKPLDFL
jgi:hypothetical protein